MGSNSAHLFQPHNLRRPPGTEVPVVNEKGRVNPHYLKHWKFFALSKDFRRQRYARDLG